ncbi:hypothetical protein [Acidocella sp.]|uniref:hypothetical protein n=1 Tax=Acidocella sp. TaxID=50710 RepID=UPI002606B373|nr:hypothetical protein [Acidocella sp.]
MTEFALTVENAVKASGLARSRIYLLLGEGKLEAKKAGKRTLIMADSLRRYLESLPPAEIGTGKTA